MDTLKPQRLRPGDLIAIVAPASPPANSSRVERGVRYLEQLGYRVVVGESTAKVRGYLAGTDDERLADLHRAFSDPRVKAIIALRGGYGTPRLLRALDYRIIRRHPKIVVGFSDITALQLALWSRCRLVTFHGPMAGVDMADGIHPFTEELFWRLVTSPAKVGPLAFPPGSAPLSLHGGHASGRLIGGNLSLISSLLGTPFFPRDDGYLLFLEELGEEPYRIDRMLAHLTNARIPSRCNAVILGQFTDCDPKDASKPSLSVSDVLTDFARSVGKPLLANLPFGHTTAKLTLPVGIRAGVDAAKTLLEYREAAVS